MMQLLHWPRLVRGHSVRQLSQASAAGPAPLDRQARYTRTAAAYRCSTNSTNSKQALR
jgi:hypothetical protein